MSEEKLYLFTIHYSRATGDPNLGYHSGLVFATSEHDAEIKARDATVRTFPPHDGWVLRELRSEEVERPILERAAADILGWNKPVSNS